VSVTCFLNSAKILGNLHSRNAHSTEIFRFSGETHNLEKRCIIRSELALTQSMPIEHLLKKFNTKNEREEGKSLVDTQSRVGLQRILKIRIPTMQDADIFEKTKSTQLHNP